MIDQLRPADFGRITAQGISMITLRHHDCRGAGNGNAPCYLHVLVDTEKASPRGKRVTLQVQRQEPLSIDDRLSPKPSSIDQYRYRNFAALPFVLFPDAAKPPVIAWTRRDGNYEKDAVLRRAAVKKEDGKPDVAISQGTAYLQGFSEDHEPAFILGRSAGDPVLVSLAVDKATGWVAAWSWPLPPPDPGDMAKMPTVDAVRPPCLPGLEAEWLSRPPQILGRKDGSTLAIFSRLNPAVPKSKTAANFQLSLLKLNRDGSCPVPAQPGPGITLDEGSDAFVRISRAPILIADLDGDGREEVTLADGPRRNVPHLLCSITETGACIAPSDSQ